MVKFALTENKKITISADIWIFGLACLLEMGSKAITLSKVLSFLAEGIPSIGMSPFSCGWSTYDKKEASRNTVVSLFAPIMEACFLFLDSFISGDSVSSS